MTSLHVPKSRINKNTVAKLFHDGWTYASIAKHVGIHSGYVHIILRDLGFLEAPACRLSDQVQQIIRLRYQEGYSVQDLQSEFSASRYDVRSALGRKLKSAADVNHERACRIRPEVTESQKQVLLGTLLGDGSISRNENRGYHVRVNHGLKQYGYADHKRRILDVGKLHIFKSYEKTYSKGVPMCTFYYKNIRTSEWLEKLVLVNGKKTVNQKWLDELTIEGIAYWFLDDGHSSFSTSKWVSIGFATMGFNHKENVLLQKKLCSMGYKTYLYGNVKNRAGEKSGTGYRLRLSSMCSDAFLKAVQPYIWPIECMRYKLKLTDKAHHPDKIMSPEYHMYKLLSD